MDIQPKPGAFAVLSDSTTWLVMVAATLLGGLASFIQKMQNKHVRVWNLTELIGELTISAFAATVAFNLCQWRQFDIYLTVAIVGMCSHMGTRAIMSMEKWLTARYPASPPNGG